MLSKIAIPVLLLTIGLSACTEQAAQVEEFVSTASGAVHEAVGEVKEVTEEAKERMENVREGAKKLQEGADLLKQGMGGDEEGAAE